MRYDGDIIVYNGIINLYGYHKLSTVLENKSSDNKNCCFVISTLGGDPNAAYRIARALHHYYKKIEVLIPDICKSAGTLVCLGAHNLIFGDRGELGPMDIQLSKPDEIDESMSGLNIIQAIAMLKNTMLSTVEQFTRDIKRNFRVQTKIASQLAETLTTSISSPILSKIDPITLGEHQRAMQIGFEYGMRLSNLSKNLRDGALEKLISGYPDHSFVIDRREAREILFKNVSYPDESMKIIYDWYWLAYNAHGLFNLPSTMPAVYHIRWDNILSFINQEATQSDTHDEAATDADGTSSPGDAEGADAPSRTDGKNNGRQSRKKPTTV